jgi:putative transposase
MLRLSTVIHAVMLLASTLFTHLLDVSRFLCLCLRPSPALAAENLFLRKQLALYQEHHVTPRRASHAARITLLRLS